MEETEQFPERVFISRQGQERRKILNFDEMMDVLSTFGFEAIRPEELSIEDQIRLFDQAETIVGASGSGLASIVFSDAASLIEIKPHDADITVWHILTTERGLQYDCLSGSGPEHRSNDMNRNTDICVDTETLAETISQHI